MHFTCVNAREDRNKEPLFAPNACALLTVCCGKQLDAGGGLVSPTFG